MGLEILPKAGSNFKVSSGIGNLKDKFSRLTRRDGSDFGNLRDNKDSIVKSLGKYAGYIRTYGGLNRMQQKAIVSDVRKQEGDKLTKQDVYDLKKVLGYYSRNQAAPKSEPKPELKKTAPVLKKENSEPAKVSPRIAINRDPNNTFLDFKGFGRQSSPGVAARVSRVVSAIHPDKLKESAAGGNSFAGIKPPEAPKPPQGAKPMGMKPMGGTPPTNNNFKLHF